MSEDKKPSIQEVLEGVRSGLSDDQLMSKFNLTPGELQGELQRLVDEGMITQAELTARASLFGETVKVSSPKGSEKRRSATGTSTTQSGDTDTAYCPNCRRDIATEPGQQFCSTCGGRLVKREEGYVPWEDGANLGWPQAFIQTVNGCLFSTKSFFSELPSYGGYQKPLIFGIVLASFGIIFNQVWEVVFQMGPMAYYGGRVVAMALVVFAPVIAVILLPLGSLLLHACLMLVSEGSHKGFEATFRVCCYSTSAQVCNVIPVLGSVANAIWSTYLLIIGVREVHKISTGRAALAVFLPWIVGVCLLVMFLFVVFKSESHVNLGPTTIQQAAPTPLGKGDDSEKRTYPVVTAASASEDSLPKDEALDLALIEASHDGNTHLVNELIGMGADINAYGLNRKTMALLTPLTAACEEGHKEVVKILLEKGANPDKPAYTDSIPLALAIDCKQELNQAEIVLMLIKAGANIKGDIGTALLDFAIEKKKLTIIGILKAHGVKESKKPPKTATTPAPQSSTLPVKTASRDSRLPGQISVESQVSGIASSVSPCEALKEYIDKYIAIWGQSGSSTNECGGKTLNSPDLSREDVECLERAAIEAHNRMMSRLQGTTNDELQRKSDELKSQYEQVLRQKPQVWVLLKPWEEAVLMFCSERMTDTDIDCQESREYARNILRVCETQ